LRHAGKQWRDHQDGREERDGKALPALAHGGKARQARSSRGAHQALKRWLAPALVAIATAAGAQPFHNNYPHEAKQSFWAWKWGQIRDGTPDAPPGGWKIPSASTDAAALRANTTEPTLTWIGHACFLVQLAGRNILFDAQFSPRASPLGFAGPPRIVPLPIDIPDLPRIDVVVISHNHYDHLDRESVKRLAARARNST
jgi:hypothetical protein